MEKVYEGGEAEISLEIPEYDANGLPHRVPHTFRFSIPKGATEGQRLRLAGRGGPGLNGGKAGDLYIKIHVAPHPVFRVSGRDLSMDLLLTPWEAVLGATVEIPTLGGKVEIVIKPGTTSGQRFRLAKRGLPSTGGESGDLFAIVKIVTPKHVSEHERELYQQLAAQSSFTPRSH